MQTDEVMEAADVCDVSCLVVRWHEGQLLKPVRKKVAASVTLSCSQVNGGNKTIFGSPGQGV